MQRIEGQTLAAVLDELRGKAEAGAGAGAAPGGEATTAYPPPGAPAPPGSTAPQAALSTDGGVGNKEYVRSVARLGAQAAEALDYAHQLGVVHRDVKPGNLMVDGRGQLWVTDFGLAQFRQEGAESLTLTGDLVGTLRYMSPEQALAKRVVVDHRTDVYSLGATLYELLTLRPVFEGGDRQELLRQITFDEPRPPRKLNKALPAELETVLLKALEKNPAERYATAKELADDMRRWLADEPIRARPAGVVRRLRKWGRRHRAWTASAAATLGAALLVLAAGIGWVASDRAARAQRTTDEIGAALKESADWQQRQRMPEALSAAYRAKAALAGGHADPALRRQVEARVADLELLAQLEEARLDADAVKDNGFDWAQTERRFGEIFRDFHLDMDAGSAEEAARPIGDSTVALELAAALDEWARLRRYLHPQEKGRWRRLLPVARAADPDRWRTQLRDALAREDRAAVAKLASSGGAEQLRSWTVLALAKALKDCDDRKAAEAMLRKAQQRHPDDFWINFNLAKLILDAEDPLGTPSRVEEAIPFRTACVALRPNSPAIHNNLGVALARKGRLDEAIAEFREAIRLKKDYALPHSNLGAALYDKGDLDGAIAAHHEAIRLKSDDAPAHMNLGMSLRHKGDVDGAIAACREAIRLKKDYASAYNELGAALLDKGDVGGGIAACREAIRLKKDYALPHYNLGCALRAKGDLDGAIAKYREAIRIQSDYPEAHTNLGRALWAKADVSGAIAEYRQALKTKKPFPEAYVAHNNLGNALKDKGRLDEAIAEYRESIRLKKDYPDAHTNLGDALRQKGRLDEALAEHREAIRLKKDYALPHNNLGAALWAKGRLDEAIAAFREAIRLKKDYVPAHLNLSFVLRQQGQFRAAAEALRHAHDLSARDPRMRQAIANELGETERLAGLAELDARLSRLLAGAEQPSGAAERLSLAALCQLHKRFYAAAARWYGEAFAARPSLADDPASGNRYNAACAAALAGCGQGEDAKALGKGERAKLREQALAWLRSDLAAWGNLMEKEPGKARAAVSQVLRHWLADPDFNGVRGQQALAGLPGPERRAWEALWREVKLVYLRVAPPRAATRPRP
jgi:tetratricopeptide (TPR) repeat protein